MLLLDRCEAKCRNLKPLNDGHSAQDRSRILVRVKSSKEVQAEHSRIGAFGKQSDDVRSEGKIWSSDKSDKWVQSVDNVGLEGQNFVDNQMQALEDIQSGVLFERLLSRLPN